MFHSVTYNVHEGEQILLDVLLAVKLDHRVVDAQQHLDVVGPVHALSARPPRPCVVDTLLHATVQRLQVHKTTEISTWSWRNTHFAKNMRQGDLGLETGTHASIQNISIAGTKGGFEKKKSPPVFFIWNK